MSRCDACDDQVPEITWHVLDDSLIETVIEAIYDDDAEPEC
jgi:hypothetical protein